MERVRISFKLFLRHPLNTENTYGAEKQKPKTNHSHLLKNNLFKSSSMQDIVQPTFALDQPVPPPPVQRQRRKVSEQAGRDIKEPATENASKNPSHISFFTDEPLTTINHHAWTHKWSYTVGQNTSNVTRFCMCHSFTL